MLDAKSLLDQFLGQAGQAKRGIDGLGGTGGLAVGGVLGLLLANKKARKMAGNVAVYGGAAALGLLAWRAYRNWQDGQKPASGPVAQPGDMPQVAPKYLPSAAPAADGNPFELALIRAMISAAKADGHLDATEQQRVFAEIERMALDAEAKSTVFAMLANPVRLEEIVASAGNEEQAAELYLPRGWPSIPTSRPNANTSPCWPRGCICRRTCAHIWMPRWKAALAQKTA